MKLKGLTKLALSGVALAAVAATLGTSTYAWYVSNSKAEINNISGQSNTTASGSLLINQLAESTTGSNVISNDATWTNKINYSSLIWTQAPNLEPVTRDTTDTTTGFHDVKGEEVAKNKAYGYFLIGIKTTDASKRTITMRLGIENDSDTNENVTPQTQTAYVGSDKGAPSNVLAGGSFKEDFIYALKFDYHIEQLTGTKKVGEYVTNGVTTTGDTPTYTRHPAYNAETFQNSAFSGTYAANGTTLNGGKTDGDAHAYYKALSEDNISSGGSIIGGEDSGTTTYGDNKQFVLNDATNEYVIVMRYWLDGADAQCFDSCISQSFKLSIKLEASASPSN